MINRFKIAPKFAIEKNEKSHPQGFFSISLITGDYNYIYITEIKIGNFQSCGILGRNKNKISFPDPKMLKNAS